MRRLELPLVDVHSQGHHRAANVIVVGEHEEQTTRLRQRRTNTHPDITYMIGPVLMHIPMKFYYRKYMLKKNPAR